MGRTEAAPEATGPVSPSPNRVRVIDATLSCLARQGTAKTTVDDIAREAGLSRATVYRVFPGGRDEVLAAVVDTEMARLFSALGVCLGEAQGLEEALVSGIVEASTRIRGHAALAYLVEHEPEMVLGHLAFDESDRLLATASRFTAPFLARWMSPMEAGRVAEWATRIVLSYVIAALGAPGPHRPGPGRTPGGDLRPPGHPGPPRRRGDGGHRHHPVRLRRPAIRRVARPSDRHPAPIRTIHLHQCTQGSNAMTTEMSTTEEIIGRSEIDDFETILSVVGVEEANGVHVVHSDYDSMFTWDYEKGARPKLNKLYEKAKGAQWNGETDLPWEIDVDQEKLVRDQAEATGGFGAGFDLKGTPVEKWGDKEWLSFGVESQNWTLSQFLHGEQGALICTAKIVESVPWIDAKYYAATQVMDEARHVEVFGKYLDEKLSGHYPLNAHLGLLLDDIIADSRWDLTYLGMQIMVEGLALAAFGFMHQMTGDPLLKQLLRYVMADEARHVAFGVLSLQEYYQGLNAAELRERQEFAFEAAVRMRDRFLQQEVWDRMGVDPKAIVPLVQQAPERGEFQALLFSKIVPNCKKLGLLDAADGWLRTKFTELGVIQFESWVDTTEEYDALASTPPKDRIAS